MHTGDSPRQSKAANHIIKALERSATLYNPESSQEDKDAATKEIKTAQQEALKHLPLNDRQRSMLTSLHEHWADPVKWTDTLLNKPGSFQAKQPLFDEQPRSAIESSLDRARYSQTRSRVRESAQHTPTKDSEQSGEFSLSRVEALTERRKKQGREDALMILTLKDQLNDDSGKMSLNRNAVQALMKRNERLEATLMDVAVTYNLANPQNNPPLGPLNTEKLRQLGASVMEHAKERTSTQRIHGKMLRDASMAFYSLGRYAGLSNDDLGIPDKNEHGALLHKLIDRSDINIIMGAVDQQLQASRQLEEENATMKDRLAGLTERLGDSPEGRELQAILAGQEPSPGPAPDDDPQGPRLS